MKGSSFYFSAKALDGLNGYTVGFDRKDIKGKNKVYMYFKSMYRKGLNDLPYLLLPKEWTANQLNNTINLDELTKNWSHHPPDFKFKRALIKQVAQIAGKMHSAGVNHRDFYLCHFLMDAGLCDTDKNIRQLWSENGINFSKSILTSHLHQEVVEKIESYQK